MAFKALIDQTTNPFASGTIIVQPINQLVVSETPGLCLQSLIVQVNVTSITPPSNPVFASSAVNTGTNTATATAHGLTTGTAVTMTTSGVLPTGLATSTTYYMIVVDANTVAWATSLVNANAGTKITLSAQGSGNDTINVTALATCNVTFQSSLDNVNWNNEATATSITTTGSIFLYPSATNVGVPSARFYRLKFAIASGQITTTTLVYGKGLV